MNIWGKKKKKVYDKKNLKDDFILRVVLQLWVRYLTVYFIWAFRNLKRYLSLFWVDNIQKSVF